MKHRKMRHINKGKLWRKREKKKKTQIHNYGK